MSETIRVCTDMVLPVSKQYEAAERAREESQRNVPDPTLLGDAVELLDAFKPKNEAGVPVHKRHSEARLVLTGKKWQTGRTLKVHFLDGPEWAREAAFEYFERWTQHANLNLVRTRDRSASDIRVTFTPGGSWSYLGTDNLAIPVDEPTMQLGWLLEAPTDDEEWRRVCVHEWGHVIGFGHEQSSPAQEISWNKPVVYDYYKRTQGWSQAQVDRQVFFKYSRLNTNFSAYDKLSIMHYSVPREFVTDPNDVVGWNTSRSKTDKEYAAWWYKKGTTQGLVDGLVRAYDVGAKV